MSSVRVTGVFLLCWFIAITVFSQIQQPNRFEKEKKFSEDDFSLIPLETDGIALIRERNKFKSGNQIWEVILLDTALQETALLELEADTHDKFIGYEYSPGFVHFLFTRSQFKGEMDLFSLNVKTKEFKQYEINPELNFQVTQFCKAGDNFIFGGYVNSESAVFLYTTAINNVKIIPGFFQKNIELVDMRANNNHETFNTIMVDRGDRDNRKIIFRTFDSSGKQLLETITDVEEDIMLQAAISSSLHREDLMIIGTWGRKNSTQSSGIFTLPVNPFTKQSINRSYFGQLEHYLDYMKPKKAAAIQAKTKKALEAGKNPDFINYVMPFKIVEYEKGFLLLGESYLPSNTYPRNYNTANNNSAFNSPYPYPYYYNPYGGYPPSRWYNPVYNQGSNINNDDNVKNVHGFVLDIDAAGNIRWDYSIKFINVKRSSMEQTGDFYFDENQLVFLYKDIEEAELIIKRINLATKEIEESKEKIKLKQANDEVRSEGRAGGLIKHWFGSSFYVWGYQTIRNKTNSNKTRDVFYINKVVVH